MQTKLRWRATHLAIAMMLGLPLAAVAAQTNQFVTNVTAVVTSLNPKCLVSGKVTYLDQDKVVLASGQSFMRSNLMQLHLQTNVTRVVETLSLTVGTNPPGILNNRQVPTALGLGDINTPQGQAVVQQVFQIMMNQGIALGMDATQRVAFSQYYHKTAEGLANGTTDLKSIRDQAASTLSALKQHSKEIGEDANAEVWRGYENILRDFVERYDRGER